MKNEQAVQNRRTTQRRTPSESDRRTDVVRSFSGERRETDRRGLALSMVDALEDILRWETREAKSSCGHTN